MKMQVTTTITTLVDLDSFTTEHVVHIDCEDPMPEALVKSVATGAARSLLSTLAADETDEFSG